MRRVPFAHSEVAIFPSRAGLEGAAAAWQRTRSLPVTSTREMLSFVHIHSTKKYRSQL
jgi:hypothetical protein